MSTQVDLGTVFKGSSSGKIVQAKGETVELKPDQVVIDIAYSGLCGSDLHFRKKGDMVLGHEGVGIISQVGKDVDFLKAGDRVGWGCNHNACNYCKQCWNGVDTLCPHRAMYAMADSEFGSFGDRAVLSGYFVHKIPDDLPLKYAGPLQCGGATVYGAIVKAGARPIDRVGVVGLGGLGHLAVQYLNKMGCEVVVFSHSSSKKEQATKLGAHEFVAVKENPEMKGVKPINHLLVSTSQQPDWTQFFKVMAARASIVPLSVSMEAMEHPYEAVVEQELRVTGSLVARRELHKELLEFSARQEVLPWIEELPMTEEGLNEAFDRLEKGDVCYRFVLKSQRTQAE